ncbi:glucose-6-phosphate dehydrogenase [Thiovibrio sp. JS02]
MPFPDTAGSEQGGKIHPHGACPMPGQEYPASCTIVIFGASGDLAARKLIPALYNLFRNKSLPRPVNIVGCGRTRLSHESFRASLREFRHKEGLEVDGPWETFAANFFYQPLTYDNPPEYRDLARFLEELDRGRGTAPNRIFYLAVPPGLYALIGRELGVAGLSRALAGNWARIVVEKPFGQDLDSAVELDRALHTSFGEEQIFRIDHYLAKETVQNILMLRFANTIFEPLWNRSFIDYVGIVTAEKIGIEHRAGYYEEAGVLRDMFQNHMMQLLALIAMEPPSRFDAVQVQDEKVKVFRALKALDVKTLKENLFLGQYTAGVVDGAPVPGYRQEGGVAADSLTPTYALLRVFLDNWRWRGVPFYLASGKRMARKETRIVIQFKNVPHSMFSNILDEHIAANRLSIGIYPHEAISLTFQTKAAGAKECLQPVTMDFRYDRGGMARSLDAYEMVLRDCMLGDHMLFWRQDGVELSWAFLTPILNACESCPVQAKELLEFYEAGSPGPGSAWKWLRLIMEE